MPVTPINKVELFHLTTAMTGRMRAIHSKDLSRATRGESTSIRPTRKLPNRWTVVGLNQNEF